MKNTPEPRESAEALRNRDQKAGKLISSVGEAPPSPDGTPYKIRPGHWVRFIIACAEYLRPSSGVWRPVPGSSTAYEILVNVATIHIDASLFEDDFDVFFEVVGDDGKEVLLTPQDLAVFDPRKSPIASQISGPAR